MVMTLLILQEEHFVLSGIKNNLNIIIATRLILWYINTNNIKLRHKMYHY
jgi:hypothetical protein